MKANLKLNEIKQLSLGIDLAVMTLELECPIEGSGKFTITSTGLSFGIESKNSSNEIFLLADWLRENSKNDNLRTNQSEIILFAKKMIKMSKEIKESVSL